jgi:hypothetical protein
MPITPSASIVLVSISTIVNLIGISLADTKLREAPRVMQPKQQSMQSSSLKCAAAAPEAFNYTVASSRKDNKLK